MREVEILKKKQLKCYLYTRVSTSMQVDGYSLDAQRDKLRKYAAYEDMIVAGEYSDEGFSGKNIQGRQEFQRMLNDIQDGKDDVSYVLVFKLSRFGRNAADVLNSLQLMQDFGVNLISVDLYTGTARIFKAGAAPGFLVHGGRARPVGDISLPIGILGGVNGQSRMVHLAAGDYAVLVSDGLLVDGPGWVAKQLELSAAAGDPPEKVARILVETARARAEQTGRPDDITAAVLRLEPCGH